MRTFKALILPALILTAAAARAPARQGYPGSVSISVLSLFHPERAVILFDSPNEIVIEDAGGSSRIKDSRLDITLIGGRMAVGGTPAGKASSVHSGDFRVEIPGRIARDYRGSFVVRPSSGGSEFLIVVTVPIEEMVSGAVLAEMGPDRHPEAHRALATAVRSNVLSSIGRHRNQGFDLCDTTHCMIYKGLEGGASLDEVRRRLMPTRGAVMMYDGGPVRAYFSASCGGRTHTPQQVWGRTEAYPYSRVTCGYCKQAPHYRWSSRISANGLSEALSIAKGTDWRLETAGEERIVLTRQGRTEAMMKEEFRIRVGRALGWNLLYSPWFDVKPGDGYYEFDGSGFGHGVGLCEEGAAEMARGGKSWKAILKKYFPGASIEFIGTDSD